MMGHNKNPHAQTISLNVVVRVDDEHDVTSCASCTGPCNNLEEALYTLMTNAPTPLVEAGIESITGRIKWLEPDLYRLEVVVDVFDSTLLQGEAEKAYQSCWNEPLDETAYEGGPSITDHLYEYLVSSNASPDPRHCGYELVKRD